jgi:hypothetical protein
MADAIVSNTIGRKAMRVRLSPRAQSDLCKSGNAEGAEMGDAEGSDEGRNQAVRKYWEVSK